MQEGIPWHRSHSNSTSVFSVRRRWTPTAQWRPLLVGSHICLSEKILNRTEVFNRYLTVTAKKYICKQYLVGKLPGSTFSKLNVAVAYAVFLACILHFQLATEFTNGFTDDSKRGASSSNTAVSEQLSCGRTVYIALKRNNADMSKERDVKISNAFCSWHCWLTKRHCGPNQSTIL